MKTQLKKEQACYNPMFLDGKEINHLVFFDATTGKTILEPENDRIKWFGNNNDYPVLEFPFEIKRRNKIDLNRVESFYTSYNSQWSSDKGRIVIYIPIQLLENFQSLGENLDFQSETAKHFCSSFSFDCLAVREYPKLNEVGEVVYLTSELEKTTLTIKGRRRTEKKELGNKIDAVCSFLKSQRITVSSYDIEQIFKHYDLIKK